MVSSAQVRASVKPPGLSNERATFWQRRYEAGASSAGNTNVDVVERSYPIAGTVTAVLASVIETGGGFEGFIDECPDGAPVVADRHIERRAGTVHPVTGQVTFV